MENFPLQKRFSVPSWFFQGSSSVRRSRRRRPFCLIFKVFWLPAPLSKQRTIPHLCLQKSQKSSCYHVMCWSATTASSRRCRRCMMGRS